VLLGRCRGYLKKRAGNVCLKECQSHFGGVQDVQGQLVECDVNAFIANVGKEI
jgi:hypothetical protein